MEYSLTLFVTFRFSTGICLNPYSNGILSDVAFVLSVIGVCLS